MNQEPSSLIAKATQVEHDPGNIKVSLFVYCLLLPIIIGVFGIFFLQTLTSSEVNVSKEENRTLFVWPTLTLTSLVNGQYTKDIESYMSDHFPARHLFMPVAFNIRAHRGFQIEDRVMQVKGAENGFEDVNSWAKPEINNDKDRDKNQNQTEQAPIATAENQENPGPANLKVMGGILIHEDQALFMFGGNDRTIKGFATAVNTWVDKVAAPKEGEGPRGKKAELIGHGPLTVSVVLAPTSSHFYLPEKARLKTTSELKNINALRDGLYPQVKFADVISEMEGHTSEPLYYKTDHHWTGLGAYYAYRAWAKSNGITPVPLSAMEKHTVKGILGSYWNLTHAPEISNSDKLSDYYVPPVKVEKSLAYTGPNQSSPVPHAFFSPNAPGYIVFLGGDLPLLVAHTAAGTGRKVLVVKNSYGNAFAPYLLSHFDTVAVVDYRYLSRNIHDIISTFGITDIVFVNVTMIANSEAHQQRLIQVAQGSSAAWTVGGKKKSDNEASEKTPANKNTTETPSASSSAKDSSYKE